MPYPPRRHARAIGALLLLAIALAVACGDDGNSPAPTPSRTPEPTATPSATADPTSVVLSWTRSGGIAGFCDSLLLTAGHRVTLGTCEDPPMSSPDGDLASNASIVEFETWRSTFASFEVEWDDGPDVADGIAISVSFIGRGADVATEDEQREIADFAARLFTETASAGLRAASLAIEPAD